MSAAAYPKDGTTFVTETTVHTAYRWLKYKPDGARQMKKAGRWQKQVWRGDFFKWENCEEPAGEIVSDDSASTLASNAERIAKLEAENARLRGALEFIDGLEPLEINLSNYDHQDVCRLNDCAVQASLSARAAISAEASDA